ncbi:MAG: hypothetical protein ACOVSR_04570 [Bacteroidia bacterium]
MNKQQIAKMNMYLAVQQTLALNKSVYENFSRLNAEVLKFNGLVTRINELHTNLSSGTNGITSGNAQLEQSMVDALVKLARVALVWAKDSKNLALITLFDITKTDLTRLTDAERYAKANNVLGQIETNYKAMGELNVLPTTINQARQLVNDYQASLGTTQSALKNNKGLNAETKTLFNEADASLVIISDLTVNATDEPIFANAFLATKVINDAAVRKTGVTIAVTGKETNEALTTAWAYVEGTDKKDDADQEGLCELYKMRPGTYIIRIEAPGYTTEKLTATIEQGKITELEISLNKA